VDFADQSYLRSYLVSVLVLCRQSPRDNPGNLLIHVQAGPAESTVGSVESTLGFVGILTPSGTRLDGSPKAVVSGHPVA
jgi:hypothetical protein